jgi:transketolase
MNGIAPHGGIRTYTALRAIPGLGFVRPADTKETAAAPAVPTEPDSVGVLHTHTGDR